MTLNVNNLIGFGSGGVGILAVTLEAFAEAGTGTTEKTYGTLAIGTAASNRGIVVIVAARKSFSGSSEATAVTVGGVSLSLVDSAVGGTGTIPTISMWEGTVPTGTTGEVIVTYTAEPTIGAVYVYSVTGRGTFAETDSDNDGHASGTGHSGTVNLARRGCVIAGCFADGSVSSLSFTGVTEDDENDIGSGDPFNCGSYGPAAADASYDVTATQSSSDKGCFVVGSFQMT